MWLKIDHVDPSNHLVEIDFPFSYELKVLCILIKANETPLQIAERNGHDEVVRYLLKEDRTEVSSDGVSLVDVCKDGESTLNDWWSYVQMWEKGNAFLLEERYLFKMWGVYRQEMSRLCTNHLWVCFRGTPFILSFILA